MFKKGSIKSIFIGFSFSLSPSLKYTSSLMASPLLFGCGIPCLVLKVIFRTDYEINHVLSIAIIDMSLPLRILIPS
jgi:hypothetical protein